MPTIGVDTILLQGSFCLGNACLSWSPYSPVDVNVGYEKDYIDSRAAGSPCENGVYKGRSMHYIIDSENELYYAYTANSQRIDSC